MSTSSMNVVAQTATSVHLRAGTTPSIRRNARTRPSCGARGLGVPRAPNRKGGGRDLNPRPPGPQPGALPTELPPPRPRHRSRGSAQRRLVQVRDQMRDRVEDGRGAVIAQLLLRPAARDHADRLEPGLRGCLDVPARVAHHDRVARARFVECGLDRVGVRLRPLDVVLGRPRVDAVARVQLAHEEVEIVLAGGAREHDREVAALQLAQQIRRTLERRALVSQLLELLRVRLAQIVAGTAFHVVAGDRRHVLVAAHPDVAVEPPHREDDVEAAKSAVPGERVLVVRVDQRAVEVQQRRLGHYADAVVFSRWPEWTPSQNSSTSFLQNAGRSSGFRDVTSPWSTTTSSSTQLPPALRMSVSSDGHDVTLRPRTTSASTSIHGPWQMTATGLPASKNERTNSTASSSMRIASGLPTPPGMTRPSYSPTRADEKSLSTLYVLDLS